MADVERALQHVQTFDPIGVAARDLQECLGLQLRHLGAEGTPAEKIVTATCACCRTIRFPRLRALSG